MNLFLEIVLAFGAYALPLAASAYESGMQALRAGRPAEALPLLESARAAAPREPEILFALASCTLRSGARRMRGRRSIACPASNRKIRPCGSPPEAWHLTRV